MDVHGGKDAAVLVPLFEDGGLHAVFTRRRDDLRRHAGEISFPGGRQDDPAEDLRFTALREAEEEIGLAPDDVELVGALQPTEVEIVLEFALRDLVAGHEMKRLVGRGVPIKTPTYTVDGNLIWGATARIVQDMLKRLKPVL